MMPRLKEAATTSQLLFSMLLPYLHSRNLYLFASLEDL